MALYDLATDAVSAFWVRRPGGQQFYRRQPLAGLVDGSNKVFLLPLYPVLSGAVIHLGTVQQTVTTHYTLDTATGTVTFVSAPTVQPTSDFTALALQNQQIVYYAWAGFQLMESMVKRGFRLSSNNTTYAMASPTSTNIYLVNGTLGTGNAVSDPVSGNLTFGTSVLQRAFLEKCMEMAYLDSMTIESALSDLDVRQRMGGIDIRAGHRSRNIKSAKESMQDELLNAMYAALDEYYPNGDHYGGKVSVPQTLMYEQLWHWQNQSGIFVPANPVVSTQ